MAPTRRFFITLFCLLSFSAPLHAADKSSWYIMPRVLPARLLPPPPEENSAAGRKQIAAVLDVQKAKGRTNIIAMRDEQHLRLDLMTNVLGGSFTRDRLPETFALLDHVFADALQIAEADKQYWHTRRPYLADHRVKLLIDPIDNSPAYPSGHTCSMRVVAEVIGLLYPDRLGDLRARADSIAMHRIEAGVHYPVDIENGRMLAMLIVGALMQNREFQDDLETARLEIDSAR